MRRLLGVVIGVVIAVAVVAGMSWVTNQLFALPVDLREGNAIGAAVEASPIAAKVLIVGGWFLGALAGGLVAARISLWQASIWAVAGIVSAACLAMVLLIPHPLWMQIAALAAPLFAAVVAKGAY